MTLEEEFSLLLDCGVTLEEDFALLLDFALDEDFAELLLDRSSTGVEDDERTELLDFAELLDTDEEDLAELLLDRSSTGAEDDDVGVTLSLLDEEGSSSRGAKLLSSSQAAKNARANPSKKRFIQKILLRYVVYLANFPSSLHPVFIIFPAKRIEHDD